MQGGERFAVDPAGLVPSEVVGISGGKAIERPGWESGEPAVAAVLELSLIHILKKGWRFATMKNEYQVSERNAIVEDHLWCIDSVIRQNYTLIKAARLDLDDVYQTLALRLIRAVAGYNPEKGILRQHIFAQLQYELLSCKSARALYGFTYAPFDLWGTVVSVEAMEEAGVDWESQIAA